MSASSDFRPTIYGLVLAGGEGQRMGGNKPFREIGGRALITHVLEVAKSQCDHVMVSANTEPDAFSAYNVPVVGDEPKPGQGPLGGILGGLNALPDGIDWLVSFPVDCPVVPGDMVARLITEARKSTVKAAYVQHAGRDHYLSSIWHRDAAPVIAGLLANEQRRVRGPLDALDAAVVLFDDHPDQPGLFANANTAEALASLNALLSAQRASDA
jgi:molybdopterin-guanine dinucleotide biosynthesis protein A